MEARSGARVTSRGHRRPPHADALQMPVEAFGEPRGESVIAVEQSGLAQEGAAFVLHERLEKTARPRHGVMLADNGNGGNIEVKFFGGGDDELTLHGNARGFSIGQLAFYGRPGREGA